MKRDNQPPRDEEDTDGSFSHGSFRFQREKYGRKTEPVGFRRDRELGRFGGINRYGEQGIRPGIGLYEDELGMRHPVDEIVEDHFGKGPKNWRRSDERIREDVCEVLARNHELDASQIEVSVSEGLVTLRGDVEDRQQKHLAEDLVDEIPGVRDVHNHLTLRKHVRGWVPGVDKDEDDRDQGLGLSKAMY